MKIKHIKLLVFTIISLLAGVYVSIEVNSVLGIEMKPKDLPEGKVVSHVENHGVESPNNSDPETHENQLRLADLGGVGILPDTANWGNNYQHNEHRFEDLFLSEEPYIDSLAYQRVEREFRQYVDHMSEFEMNGIVMEGFLEFVTFQKLEEPVYSNQKIIDRLTANRNTFIKLMKYANSKGMKVYLRTDMPSFSSHLEKYINDRFGGFDGENPELWKIYQAAAEEVYENMPVEGIMIRIGEAGTVYNMPGWDFYSQLYVKDAKSVKVMLEAFLETAEKYNKTIIFRSWSVGVGEIGDMHTNNETYQSVVEQVQSDNLVISTKYCQGDFYSYLPVNQTLLQGSHRRIIEYQSRREFEGLGSLPNYMAPLHQLSLQKIAESNPNLEGAWLWTQGGGPLRAGPLSIYPFHGFNVYTDANVYATGKLIQNPYANLDSITVDWVKHYFGEDSLLVENVKEILMMSHEVNRMGLYIEDFARWDMRALGLEPPPMMWIFEWDMLTTSGSVLSNIYYTCKEDIDGAIAEGFEAVKQTNIMLEKAKAVHEKVSLNQEDYDKFIESLEYQSQLFSVLARYRQFFLNYYAWLDAGDPARLEQWEKAQGMLIADILAHEEQYNGHLDFPSYNFDESKTGIRMISNSGLAIWMARVLIIIFLLVLLLGSPFVQERFGRNKFSASAAVLYSSLFGIRWLKSQRGQGHPVIILLQLMLIVGGILALSSFHAIWLSLGIVIFSILFLFSIGSVQYFSSTTCPHPSDLMGALMPGVGLVMLPLTIVSLRGPGQFYYLLWTSEMFRTVFITLLVVLLLWNYYAFYQKLRGAFGLSRLGTTAQILLTQGIQFIVGGSLVILLGFEYVLTIFNDEIQLLPGGLSRILGITTHLDIPLDVPWWVLSTGIVLLCLGGSFKFFERKERLG